MWLGFSKQSSYKEPMKKADTILQYLQHEDLNIFWYGCYRTLIHYISAGNGSAIETNELDLHGHQLCVSDKVRNV